MFRAHKQLSPKKCHAFVLKNQRPKRSARKSRSTWSLTPELSILGSFTRFSVSVLFQPRDDFKPYSLLSVSLQVQLCRREFSLFTGANRKAGAPSFYELASLSVCVTFTELGFQSERAFPECKNQKVFHGLIYSFEEHTHFRSRELTRRQRGLKIIFRRYVFHVFLRVVLY